MQSGKHDKLPDFNSHYKNKGKKSAGLLFADPDGSGASSESDFSLRKRKRSKSKKLKKKVGRPRKEEPFIVFERAELRPSTIEDCLHAAVGMSIESLLP